MTDKPTLPQDHDDDLLERTPPAESGEPLESPDESRTADAQPLADHAVALAEIEAELAAANDRALRAQAELENFRKRAARQLEEERKYAALPMLRDLLPVVDNLQRAIAAAETSQSGQGLLDGVQLVAQQLTDVLQQHHCTEIDAKGKIFDPHQHHAVAHLASDQCPAETVLEVTQAGYMLHDRVVRAAQVLVSSGPPAAAGAGGSGANGAGGAETHD